MSIHAHLDLMVASGLSVIHVELYLHDSRDEYLVWSMVLCGRDAACSDLDFVLSEFLSDVP